MENTVPTTHESNKKEEFKVIPVREKTRDRLKYDMMKVDTYDSYINKKLDYIVELEKQIAELKAA
jgi:hypothetical protein